MSTGEAIVRLRARPLAPDSLRRRAVDGNVATVTAELSARIPTGTGVSGAFPGAFPPLLATVAYLIFATGLRGVHGTCVLIDRGYSSFIAVRDGDIRTFRAFAREFPIEQAILSARQSVQKPDEDWLDPELAERMADIAAELHAEGDLKGLEMTGEDAQGC